MWISVRGGAGILLLVRALLTVPSAHAQAVLPDDPFSNNTFTDGASVAVTDGLAAPTSVVSSSTSTSVTTALPPTPTRPPGSGNPPPSETPDGPPSPGPPPAGSDPGGPAGSGPASGTGTSTGTSSRSDGAAAGGAGGNASPTSSAGSAPTDATSGGNGTSTGSSPKSPGLPVNEKARPAPRNMHVYTLPPFSPMFELSPGPGPEAEGWNLSFSHSPWSSWMDDAVAMGQPVLSTSLAKASLSLEFVGSAIFFNGTLDGSITITVQNKHIQGDKGQVRTVVTGTKGATPMRELTLMGDAKIPGLYNATITVNSGSFSLMGIDITAPLGGLGSRGTTKTMPMVEARNLAPGLTEIGEWNVTSDFCGYSMINGEMTRACAKDAYDCATTTSENARLQIAAPANATLFTIYGTMGQHRGPFQVTRGDTPFDPDAKTYTSKLAWAKNNLALYTGVLDPRKQNLINLDYLGNSDMSLQVHQVLFILAVGGETDYDYIPGASSQSGGQSTATKSTPVGAIVGGAVGGGLGVLAIGGGLLWFFCRRNKKRKAEEAAEIEDDSPFSKYRPAAPVLRHGSDSVFEVEPTHGTDEDTITPLPAPSAEPLSRDMLVERKRREAYTREAYGHRYNTTQVGQFIVTSSQPHHSQASSPTDPFGDQFRDVPRNPGPNDPNAVSDLKRSIINGAFGRSEDLTPPLSAVPSQSSGTGSGASLSSSLHKLHSSTVLSGNTGTAMSGQSRTVTEEEDAGRIPAPGETIPPRYNPAWADDYLPSAAGPSGRNTDVLLESGPTRLAESYEYEELGGPNSPLSPTSPTSNSRPR